MKTLVTGAGGFLGLYIVEQLVARGDAVRGFCRGHYPELAALGVEVIRGDLRDRAAVVAACRGVDCVFHVGGMAGVWGPWQEFYETNTLGTRHVVEGCLQHGVTRLVYTSSPSVTFDGDDQCGVDESAPYPQHWLCPYPRSKALAEQHVLESNGRDGLLTCSLRPHLIWGPRDRHLIPRVIARARSGRLRRVGDGTNLIDMVYVENAAAAHLLAADALASAPSVKGSGPCFRSAVSVEGGVQGPKNGPDPAQSPAGKAYFISQGEPVNCWKWIDEILAIAGLPPVRKALSLKAAWRIGAILEAVYGALRLRREPPMTRFVAAQLAKSHYFDISAARRDFGYGPSISTAEGLRRLATELQTHRMNHG